MRNKFSTEDKDLPQKLNIERSDRLLERTFQLKRFLTFSVINPPFKHLNHSVSDLLCFVRISDVLGHVHTKRQLGFRCVYNESGERNIKLMACSH